MHVVGYKTSHGLVYVQAQIARQTDAHLMSKLRRLQAIDLHVQVQELEINNVATLPESYLAKIDPLCAGQLQEYPRF